MEYKITTSVIASAMILNFLYQFYVSLIGRSISLPDTIMTGVSDIGDWLFFLSVLLYFFHFYRISIYTTFGIAVSKYGRNVLVTMLVTIIVVVGVFFFSIFPLVLIGVVVIVPVTFYILLIQPLRMKPITPGDKNLRSAILLPVFAYIVGFFANSFFTRSILRFEIPFALLVTMIAFTGLLFPGSFIFGLYRLSLWKSRVNDFGNTYDLMYRQAKM